MGAKAPGTHPVSRDRLPMRILFALHTWNPEGRGGTEVHALDLARALSARGHQIGVFARTARPDRPAYEVTTEWQGRIGVTRINNLFDDGADFDSVYRNGRVHEAFDREVHEFKPDLVHIHHLTGLSTTIVESLKLRGMPVVHTLHDFWTFCPRGQRMTAELELCEEIDRRRCARCLAGMWPHWFDGRDEKEVVDRRGRLAPERLAEWERHMGYVLDLCDLLVTPSEFHRERMLEHGTDPARTVALPHGMELERFTATTERDPSLPVRNIGYIGSLIPPKGAHVLIEAFNGLEDPDLELHLHGICPSHHEDANYGERLAGLVAPGRKVHFHGKYDPEDVPSILRGLDLLVIPSIWWETFCLTLREGLLAGVPVVASDHGALREALDGERDGLLFRPGDARDLRRVVRKVLENEALRARLSQRRQAVRGMEDYAARMEELYARAGTLARERHGKIVVARPWFPAPRASSVGRSRVLPPRPVAWQEVEATAEAAAGWEVVIERGEIGARGEAVDLHLSLRQEEREEAEAIALKVRLERAARSGAEEAAAPEGDRVRRISLSNGKGRRRTIPLSPPRPSSPPESGK